MKIYCHILATLNPLPWGYEIYIWWSHPRSSLLYTQFAWYMTKSKDFNVNNAFSLYRQYNHASEPPAFEVMKSTILVVPFLLIITM